MSGQRRSEKSSDIITVTREMLVLMCESQSEKKLWSGGGSEWRQK